MPGVQPLWLEISDKRALQEEMHWHPAYHGSHANGSKCLAGANFLALSIEGKSILGVSGLYHFDLAQLAMQRLSTSPAVILDDPQCEYFESLGSPLLEWGYEAQCICVAVLEDVCAFGVGGDSSMASCREAAALSALAASIAL